jgi:hypothetical protein
MHAYSISCVPFYDTKQQQYIKILCVNTGAVAGPLAARVKTVRPPRLSGFCGGNGNTHGNACGGNNCIHAITAASTASCGDYMTPDQLPELFAFLTTNGYTVDLGLTKLAAKHQPNGCASGSLVCLISF